MPITETADSADTKAEGYRGVGRDAFWPRPSEVYSAGFYGINGFAETNMPPGPSAILGVFGIIWGFSRLVYLRVFAIFGVLGFLAAYELLRRQAPRLVAAAIACF